MYLIRKAAGRSYDDQPETRKPSTRSFEPLVRLIGGERTAQMSLSFACLDDWREEEIRAAITEAKRALRR
jgi:hypothetical protein